MTLLEIDDKVYKIPNKVMQAFEDMSDYIRDLEKENKKLKEELEEEENKIDKAIEYIEENKSVFGTNLDMNYLLKILKGSEE